MSRQTFRWNDWSKRVDAKCHGCGDTAVIIPAKARTSWAKAWGHVCPPKTASLDEMLIAADEAEGTA